jgi:hypothetical protein
MHAWNAFRSQDSDKRIYSHDVGGVGSFLRPDRPRINITNERSIVSSIYTRLGIDVASTDIRHVRLDDEKRYLEDIESGLNDCLTVEANIDQSAQAFLLDIVLTLFDRGHAAVVPVDTTINPQVSGGFDIKTMRVGHVVGWFPRHVTVELYDDIEGIHRQITVRKEIIALIYNPLYTVMNEPNSTLQRLIRKLNMLDAVDEASASGKLDLIIQLPYVIRSEGKRKQAEQRARDIEFQLKGSKYGIAYTDGTEKITQLNRPAENNLMAQITYLVEMLYGQLGLTPEVMNGTADENTMLNYYARTIAPILTAITQELKRKFLTKTARSQKQSIEFFRNPFELVTMKDFAEVSDKLAGNEVVSSNELRQFIGIKPSKDPKADELRNSNMPHPDEMVAPDSGGDLTQVEDLMNSVLDDLEAEVDQLIGGG